MTGTERLDDLALLVRVARSGSIGQVASELRLSQPTVSRRLARLERALGIRLLTRSRRGTTPTQVGAVVVDWANELLAAADRFDDSVQMLREQAYVSTRVAASMTVAEHYAPRWLAALHGDVRGEIAMSVGNSAMVTESVDGGLADLGFIEAPVVTHGLSSERVGWDSIGVAVRPDHPWALSHQPISMAELAAAPLLVREAGSGTRETLERALAKRGYLLTVGLVLPSNTALTSAAVAGMGPVVVSELAVQAELAARQLALVAVEGLDVRRPLTAVWHPTRRLSPAAAALVAVAGRTGSPR